MMTPEEKLARFVAESRLDAVGAEALDVTKRILLTVLGTAVAGARESGVGEALTVYGDAQPRGQGATVLVHDVQLPAANAAAVNGLMARALDFCDAMAPGLHIGSSLVPAALAAAELRGGCTGRELLEALVVGAELASRMNLGEAQYAGLDPTGIAGVFGATAAASRVLRLGPKETLHALALAFNRCGGSFQSNVDGSLAVRTIQGWVAADGVNCARLAKAGITGPRQFVAGVYGYSRLYAKEPAFAQRVVQGLGEEWRVTGTVFKKYPSCGLTQGVTELAMQFVARTGLHADDIAHVVVRLPSYAYKLVGHPFALGDNPRVNAQFSAQYCVANVFVRRGATLDHFTPERVADAALKEVIGRIRPVCDTAMDSLHHTAVAIRVEERAGGWHDLSLDIAPGFSGNGLSQAEHVARFEACLDYAGPAWRAKRSEALTHTALALEEFDDGLALIRLCSAAGV